MRSLQYIFIFGAMLFLLGCSFTGVYIWERCRKYTAVQGRIADVILTTPRREFFFGYVPIIEYKFNGRTYRTRHRVMTPKPGKKYLAGDIVQLRVYDGRPDDAIIDEPGNLRLPLLGGIAFMAAGAALLVLWACLR